MPEDPSERERTEADKSLLATSDSELNVLENFCQIYTPRGTRRGLSNCRCLQSSYHWSRLRSSYFQYCSKGKVTGRQFPNIQYHTEVSKQLSQNQRRQSPAQLSTMCNKPWKSSTNAMKAHAQVKQNRKQNTSFLHLLGYVTSIRII